MKLSPKKIGDTTPYKRELRVGDWVYLYDERIDLRGYPEYMGEVEKDVTDEHRKEVLVLKRVSFTFGETRKDIKKKLINYPMLWYIHRKDNGSWGADCDSGYAVPVERLSLKEMIENSR